MAPKGQSAATERQNIAHALRPAVALPQGRSRGCRGLAAPGRLCGCSELLCPCAVLTPAAPVLPSATCCAQVMPLMAEGFRMGLVKFVLITARKPE